MCEEETVSLKYSLIKKARYAQIDLLIKLLKDNELQKNKNEEKEGSTWRA